jgi:hypothetical protein
MKKLPAKLSEASRGRHSGRPRRRPGRPEFIIFKEFWNPASAGMTHLAPLAVTFQETFRSRDYKCPIKKMFAGFIGLPKISLNFPFTLGPLDLKAVLPACHMDLIP